MWPLIANSHAQPCPAVHGHAMPCHAMLYTCHAWQSHNSPILAAQRQSRSGITALAYAPTAQSLHAPSCMRSRFRSDGSVPKCTAVMVQRCHGAVHRCRQPYSGAYAPQSMGEKRVAAGLVGSPVIQVRYGADVARHDFYGSSCFCLLICGVAHRKQLK